MTCTIYILAPDVKKESISCEKYRHGSTFLSKLINNIGNIVFLLVGGIRIFAKKIGTEEFIISINYAKEMNRILFLSTSVNISLQNYMVSVERVMELLEKCKEIIENENSKVRIESLKKDSIWGLKNIDLEINRKNIIRGMTLLTPLGKHIALLGKNGAGKTTVMNLLCRIYTPTKGDVVVGDMKAGEISYDCLNSYISYIRQQPIIYSMTIKDNICLAEEAKECSVEKILEVCRDVEILQDIMEMPDKFDTYISENYHLSTGQKKKIQLARCILRKTPIVLIDEPTSNLDEYLTQKFTWLMEKYFWDKTIILVSHDKRIVRNFDKTLEIKDGTLFELES